MYFSIFFPGKQFNGTNRTYIAEDETLHITLRETREDAVFHERVNSANCSCMEGNIIVTIYLENSSVILI